MAVPAVAARPSRRFLVVAGIGLVVSVAVALLLTGGWPWHAKDPEPPDVWQREGAPEDLRMAPDGEHLTGWFLEAQHVSPQASGGPDVHFLILGIDGRQRAPFYREFIDNRFRKDPWKWMRERGDQNVTRTGEPVDTPSGRWWHYAPWKGTRTPVAPPK